MPRNLLAILALVFALLPGPPACAAPSAGETLTPAQAQQALNVLQDDAKRTQLLQVLRSIALAAALPPAAAPHPAAPVTLGGQVVQALGSQASVASREVSATIAAVTNFPLLWDWAIVTIRNPQARDEILQTTWRLLLILGVGVLADLMVLMLRRRPVHALEAVAKTHACMPPAGAGGTAPLRQLHAVALLRRLPLALARLLVDLLGPVAFALVAYIGLGIFAQDAEIRAVIIPVLNAYLLARVILCGSRLLLAPDAPALRLLPIADAAARRSVRWVRRLVLVAMFGPALVSTAEMLGLYPDAADALNKLVGLVFSLLLIMLVLRVRRAAATAIAGPPYNHGFVVVLRRRLAMAWHLWAIVLILALWVVWAFQISHGFERILRLFLTTAVVVAVGRLSAIVLLGAADRLLRVKPEIAARHPGLEQRALRYAPLIRRLLSCLIVIASFVFLLQLWGIDALGWFERSSVGSRLLSALLAIATVIMMTWVLWEGANALLDSQVAHLTGQAQFAKAARLRTLAPILRTSLLAVMLVFLVLTVLSEIGVNTGPLLAGASIFGVALGFGSQKLVQDFITGLFLLLENAMQVGDWVTVSGLSGAVENLSIRTIRLRAGDGSVHIIPFSSVTSVTNVNRGIGNAALGITVAAHEDTDRVCALFKEIGVELRRDADYGPMILGDVEVWGIDKLDGTGVTISGQIQCSDGGRWGVQREFNRRLKRRLQDGGISLAVPVQTVVVQREREAPVHAAAAAQASASMTVSPPPQALGNQS